MATNADADADADATATDRTIQPPSMGKLITILSIDGGGIRGLIPATMLDFLEAKLQVHYIFLKKYS
jgi:hypothetical protein